MNLNRYRILFQMLIQILLPSVAFAEVEQSEPGPGLPALIEPEPAVRSEAITGRVTEISAQTLEISTEDGVYEFTRSKLPRGVLRGLQVGDRVAFRMKEGTETLELRRAPAASGGDSFRPDDRAFYFA